MIQLMSRAGNFSCAQAGRLNCAMPPVAAAPSAAPPRCARNHADRSATCQSCGAPSARPRCASFATCPGQPCSETLVERTSIQEVCQCDVLRHEAGGVNQNPLVVALPTFLLTRYQLVDLAIKLSARELARLDHAPELTLQHVEVPTVDDDLVHLRPAG